MKKKEKRLREKKEHRGNNSDPFLQYQREMNVVHRVPKTYYTSEGELIHVGTRKTKINH